MQGTRVDKTTRSDGRATHEHCSPPGYRVSGLGLEVQQSLPSLWDSGAPERFGLGLRARMLLTATVFLHSAPYFNLQPL